MPARHKGPCSHLVHALPRGRPASSQSCVCVSVRTQQRCRSLAGAGWLSIFNSQPIMSTIRKGMSLESPRCYHSRRTEGLPQSTLPKSSMTCWAHTSLNKVSREHSMTPEAWTPPPRPRTRSQRLRPQEKPRPKTPVSAESLSSASSAQREAPARAPHLTGARYPCACAPIRSARPQLLVA